MRGRKEGRGEGVGWVGKSGSFQYRGGVHCAIANIAEGVYCVIANNVES